MQVTRTYRYEGTIDQVRAVLAQPSLYEAVAARSGALSHSIDITDEGGTIRAELHRELPTDNVPSFAQGFVGKAIRISETTWWPTPIEDGPITRADGRFEVAIAGAPVTYRGTLELEELGGEVTQTVNGELKAAVPFVGKKIEAGVEPLIGHQLDVFAELVGTELARQN